ncbi:hypothetical protein [Kitasatospora cheerisanensis]|uniref:Uncharacterized protein n=1 Tax=Kitasatospora cheerisanensis KCTC 2395 TaxID=1348663 RepID=A0A066Z8U2_9ACTN|nr:hypothetical protein [Kitasatospora cheerisanensis]KDN86726.1 hypothetical protein KCH_15140 [Kitasatospora cheerisanensis KCTC 2395]
MTTPPDLTAAADRIAASLITYALTNITDILDNAIGETIVDDPDCPADGTIARDDLWDAVLGRLKAVPAEYARRDQVLTEAATRVLGLQVREPLDDVDHHVNDVLRHAARAVQEG